MLIGKSVGLLLPRVANLDQLLLFLVMNDSQFITATIATVRISCELTLQLANRLSLLLLLSFKLLYFPLKLNIGLTLTISCRSVTIFMVLPKHLLRFQVHIADILDLG